MLISKYVANREKDRRYCRAAAKAGLAKRHILEQLLVATEIAAELRGLIGALIAQDFA